MISSGGDLPGRMSAAGELSSKRMVSGEFTNLFTTPSCRAMSFSVWKLGLGILDTSNRRVTTAETFSILPIVIVDT